MKFYLERILEAWFHASPHCNINSLDLLAASSCSGLFHQSPQNETFQGGLHREQLAIAANTGSACRSSSNLGKMLISFKTSLMLFEVADAGK